MSATGNLLTEDYRRIHSHTFQALRGLCELINQTLSDSLTRFYLGKYVSASVTSLDVFQLEVETLIEQFKFATINRFLLALSIIRNTTQSNALSSALLTNYNFVVSTDDWYAYSIPVSYSECSCTVSATCVREASIYSYYNSITVFTVLGFYVGCYVIESLLRSNLECFFQQSCVDSIQFYLTSSVPSSVRALDSSMTSTYSINSTINDLVRNLMIEEWNLSTMYEGYYNQCQSVQCTYTYEAKNDAIYIVTTLIGLLGGLATTERLVVLLILKLIRRTDQERPTIGRKRNREELNVGCLV